MLEMVEWGQNHHFPFFTVIDRSNIYLYPGEISLEKYWFFAPKNDFDEPVVVPIGEFASENQPIVRPVWRPFLAHKSHINE